MTPSDDKLLQLYMDGFPSDSKEYAAYFISSVPEENIVTFEMDGKLVSACYIVKKRALLFDCNIEVDYLSAVSTLSAYRGRGLVSNVIKPALCKMRNGNAVFAALYPFDYNYYLRYGFVNASYCGKTLICGGKDYKIKKAEACDKNELKKIYDVFSEKFNFFEVYDESFFESYIQELAIDDGAIYIAYDKKNKPFAFSAIDNGSMAKHAFLNCGAFKKINYFKGMTCENFSAGKSAYVQMRIVNVEKFLESDIFRNKKTSFTIKVSDDIISENNGVFVSEFSKGKRRVYKTDEKALKNSDKKYDVTSLANAFFKGEWPFNPPKTLFMDKY